VSLPSRHTADPARRLNEARGSSALPWRHGETCSAQRASGEAPSTITVDRTAATPNIGDMPTSPPGLGRIRRSALAGVATTRSQRATKEVTWPNWTCKTGDLNAVRARSGFFLLPARPVSTATRAEVAFYETGRHLSLRQRGRNLRHDFRRASFAIPWHAPLSSIYT
jgi:hypothetical protein